MLKQLIIPAIVSVMTFAAFTAPAKPIVMGPTCAHGVVISDTTPTCKAGS